MITHTPPSNPQIMTSDTTTRQSLQTDLQSLNNDSVSDYFRSLALRHYLETVIRKNEKAGVTTDVSVLDLQSQQTILERNGNTEQFAASVNKLPIAQLVLNDVRSQKLRFNQVLSWDASDVRAGAGVYDQAGAPTKATVSDLLFDMLNPSGNTAVRVFVNRALGGANTVNQRFKAELGLQHTYLQPLQGTSFYVGNTTSAEALKNIRTLLGGSDGYRQFVNNALSTNIYTDYGVRSQLAGNDFIILSNKVGILDDPEGNNRHDVGIIYNTKTGRSYAYAFMNTAHGEAYNTATSQAAVSLADMGKATLRYAGDKPVKTVRDTPVESLKSIPRPDSQRQRY